MGHLSRDIIVKSVMISCWHRLSNCFYRVGKMAWEEILRNLSLLISIFIFETRSIHFQITRPKINIKPDLFTNERALSKANHQPQHDVTVRQFCLTKNASCLAWKKCYLCECQYGYSTFYMYSKFPLRYDCVGNEEIRRLTGKPRRFNEYIVFNSCYGFMAPIGDMATKYA